MYPKFLNYRLLTKFTKCGEMGNFIIGGNKVFHQKRGSKQIKTKKKNGTNKKTNKKKQKKTKKKITIEKNTQKKNKTTKSTKGGRIYDWGYNILETKYKIEKGG